MTGLAGQRSAEGAGDDHQQPGQARYQLTTVGEGQIRLTVPRGDRLRSVRQLTLSPAGSEANVAGLLAQLGRRTAWASVLPQGELPDRFLDEYRGVGVDLSHVVRPATGRIALYFLEPGELPLPGRVTYDREHTPFRDATPDQFDWDALLDTDLLFVTGITAALTTSTARLVSHAVSAASERGIPVALDVNYRATLWEPDQAAAVLLPMLAKVSLLLCSRADGNRVFGIVGDGEKVSAGLREQTGVADIVTTDHTNGVFHAGPDSENLSEAGPVAVHHFPVSVVPVVDRPGAGDAFVGGTLHGYLDHDLAAGIRHGQTAAALALTHHGDLTRITPNDLQRRDETDIVR